ncbi:hypothetical protein ODU14_02000 [Streptococcus suis]|uniref:hypothetical protein n=1 Tax=Streptococcus suis TaxID=1307 RepID=UPI0015573948|nr:hypothetical protein [Streptococcus suis]
MLKKFLGKIDKVVNERGWAKSPAPLLNVSVNISAQWLIGRFVRVLHSKSDLINCAGVGVNQSGDRLFQLNNWK